jgi:hypothetical protein
MVADYVKQRGSTGARIGMGIAIKIKIMSMSMSERRMLGTTTKRKEKGYACIGSSGGGRGRA